MNFFNIIIYSFSFVSILFYESMGSDDLNKEKRERKSGYYQVSLQKNDFEKKILEFSHIFDTSHSVDPHKNASKEIPQLSRVIAVPELCAYVHKIDNNDLVRLETAGTCRCVAVAAWNTEKIGLFHWVRGTEIDSMQKFVDDMTDHGSVSDITHFLLVSNHLTQHLKDVHQFLLNKAQPCTMSIELSHTQGGYSLVDNGEEEIETHTYTGPDGQTVTHEFTIPFPIFSVLDSEHSTDFNPWSEKSLSIMSHNNGEAPYTFTATKASKHLEKYFQRLRAHRFSPEDFWRQYYPDRIEVELPIVKSIALKLYENFLKDEGNLMPQRLIYLYD